jgi:uncharacterized protein DUF87
MSSELSALRAVDFQWTTHMDSVWHELPFHVHAFQAAASKELSFKLERLIQSPQSASPLGIPLLGASGAGKTHLLNSLRKAAWARGVFFVLVDMTDVSSFHETLLLGTLRSLCQPGLDGTPQWHAVLTCLIQEFGDAQLKAEGIKGLAAARPPGLIARCDRLIQAIRRRHPNDGREHQDVVRALILLASDDFDIVDLGDGWLQGIGLSREEADAHGFRFCQQTPALLYRGLSWLMSLAAPTVLALDQLDAAVAEHNLASPEQPGADLSERQNLSLATIQGLAGGLLGLRDTSRRTQVVVSCLEATWAILDGRSMMSMQDRFEAPTLLRPLCDPALLERLVELRLSSVYRAAGVLPPYPCYPFSAEFFSEMTGASPRELLKRCDAYRRECLARGAVGETGRLLAPAAPQDLSGIERRFEELRRLAPIDRLLADEDEASLDGLIESACQALADDENPATGDVDATVELHSSGRGAYEPLHARIRLVFHADGDRERHYALRFLQKSHYRSFQARLRAAITASGIESDVPFRRLAVLRVGPPPAGPASEKLMDDLCARGGILLEPSRSELASLWAIRALREDTQHSRLLPAWLASKRPVSQLRLFADALHWLYGKVPSVAPLSAVRNPRRRTPSLGSPLLRINEPPSSKRRITQPGLGKAQPTPDPRTVQNARSSLLAGDARSGQAAPARRRPPPTACLPLGERRVGDLAEESVELPLLALRQHAAVFGGAGSGRTVLLKRLIEETVLLAIPAIIIDTSNDFALLGDQWQSAPTAWKPGDATKATLYHSQSEVVIWTPGAERGNPLSFNPIPDLAAVAEQPHELDAALSMLLGNLAGIIGPPGGEGTALRVGVLMGALHYFAGEGGGSVEALIALLSDLPPEAYPDCATADQIARELGERLLAEAKINTVWSRPDTAPDPRCLFESSHPDRTRVSVINLSGLRGTARQQFMAQLSMTLFCCMKRRSLGERALIGLLVLDDAREFAPASRSRGSKDNLLHLVGQARTYGLGMLFASESPTSIDAQILASCATHIYGRVTSASAADAARKQIQLRGGGVCDVTSLSSGSFYFQAPGVKTPDQVDTRLCLSAHARVPVTELGVLERAVRCRSESVAAVPLAAGLRH